jgi:hypothetical protein
MNGILAEKPRLIKADFAVKQKMGWNPAHF